MDGAPLSDSRLSIHAHAITVRPKSVVAGRSCRPLFSASVDQETKRPGHSTPQPGSTVPSASLWYRVLLRSRPEDTRMNEASARETLGFQAEVQQLLHLMIHSLYGHKEIFLRELVSNASDACDKLRFESIANAALLEDGVALTIRVGYDKHARTITVSDNGIGMSRQEVIEHIGTIAKSGTREFFQQLTADRANDAHLIGQFGVGFYSAFIVADRVTLTTRRSGL